MSNELREKIARTLAEREAGFKNPVVNDYARETADIIISDISERASKMKFTAAADTAGVKAYIHELLHGSE